MPRTKTPAGHRRASKPGARPAGRAEIFFVDDNLNRQKEIRHAPNCSPPLVEWQRTSARQTAPTSTRSVDQHRGRPACSNCRPPPLRQCFHRHRNARQTKSLAECGQLQNRRATWSRNQENPARRHPGAGRVHRRFDSDGPSIFQRQIDFIQKSGIVTEWSAASRRLRHALYDDAPRSRLRAAGTGDNVDGTSTSSVMSGPCCAKDINILKSIYSPRSLLPSCAHVPARVSHAGGHSRIDFARSSPSRAPQSAWASSGASACNTVQLLSGRLSAAPAFSRRGDSGDSGHHFEICELHVLTT